MLSLLLLDGPLTLSQLAGMLGVAPTTVSLIVSDLSRKRVLVRREDDADRRRRIIDISPESRPAIAQWLSPGAHAWRQAIAPLSPAQQRISSIPCSGTRRPCQPQRRRHQGAVRSAHRTQNRAPAMPAALSSTDPRIGLNRRGSAVGRRRLSRLVDLTGAET
jgi:DNA-binding MarR family transcriptional regulator